MGRVQESKLLLGSISKSSGHPDLVLDPSLDMEMDFAVEGTHW